jgi:hypothetical protein
MTPDRQSPKAAIYWLLLAIQIVGAISFVWQELPEFGQVLDNPGEQLPKNIKADLMVAGIFVVMQIAFWIRVLRVPVPFRRPNIFLNYVFLFLGRLSFIFGSALFSVVVFSDHSLGIAREEALDIFERVPVEDTIRLVRHVPQMGRQHRVRERAERVTGRQRFGLEYVQTSTRKRARAERRHERCFVYDRATRGVDQERARLEQSELGRSDEPARALGEHQMNTEHVRATK